MSILILLLQKTEKLKGQFITDPELGSSCDFLVIPKMLEWYFIQNIKPETVIEDP